MEIISSRSTPFGGSTTSMEPRGKADPMLAAQEDSLTCFGDPFFEVRSEVVTEPDAAGEV